MQHDETQKRQPDVEDFGADPLTESGFEDELPESEFDTEAAPEPGEEERQ
jgi:hypothetical protein